MKEVKNYILLVDNHRRPSRQRNTAGRYRVGAKTPEEAVKLLRDKIGFGSIQVYYECKPGDGKAVGYKEVVREVLEHDENNKVIPVHKEVHHVNAPRVKQTKEHDL